MGRVFMAALLCLGKSAEDGVKLASLDLKPGFKIMMMGSLEEDITAATTAPENVDQVVNDLDLTEEEVALENREEYLSKVCFFSAFFVAGRLISHVSVSRFPKELILMRLRSSMIQDLARSCWFLT